VFVRRHRQLTADDARAAEALFRQLLDQGELWAEAERIVAEHLGIDVSTWRRWRVHIRRKDWAWFGPPMEPARRKRGSNDATPDMAEVMAALTSLLGSR
jgi:hypothetical protein